MKVIEFVKRIQAGEYEHLRAGDLHKYDGYYIFELEHNAERYADETVEIIERLENDMNAGFVRLDGELVIIICGDWD